MIFEARYVAISERYLWNQHAGDNALVDGSRMPRLKVNGKPATGLTDSVLMDV